MFVLFSRKTRIAETCFHQIIRPLGNAMNNRGMCKAVSDNDNDDNGYRRDKVKGYRRDKGFVLINKNQNIKFISLFVV